MADKVTLVIHAAANISLKAPLQQAIYNNCLPTLRLAELAVSRFTRLSTFAYVSSAYANCFLPDGKVEEKIYEVGNVEHQLAEILATGSLYPGSVPHWIWPYTCAKHMTERLLMSRHPTLPLLILRPTCIAPAISEPHPYYARAGSCPLSTYIREYMKAPDSGVIHVSPRHRPGSNIVDEIPVDLVANLLLLHLDRATNGIVHASSQSYVPRSIAQLHHTIATHMPVLHPSYSATFRYETDVRTDEGLYNEFWGIMAL
ncbi:male sterility protein-domain-containing protein [Mycena metata]|uniref:Fatty acyl-CoA reductase n=1 Tax=Mycena metata TaxID=1033252 RepID=A0AAD7I3M5_9AGAR|nr:male sterility protein-domain-containing protein [Mycena metata]